MKITKIQKAWLDSRGGRDSLDVIDVGEDLFVIMAYKNNYKPVMIPSDKGIKEDYKVLYGRQNKIQLKYRLKRASAHATLPYKTLTA